MLCLNNVVWELGNNEGSIGHGVAVADALGFTGTCRHFIIKNNFIFI